MLQLDITKIEVAQGRIFPVHLAAAVDAIRDEGFVVLHNAVDVAHVDALCAAMYEDIERGKARRNGMDGFLSAIPRQESKFLFKDIAMNALAEQVMIAVMEGPRISCGFYTSNTTAPGAGDQMLHVDMRALEEGEQFHGPCNCVVVNVPMIDFTIENGATEIWPGTHRCPRPVGEFWVNETLQANRRPVRAPELAIMPRGSILIRDIRLWHRGTPNQTRVTRPMVGMIMNGGFNPAFDPISKIPMTGQFPKDCEPFFRDDPKIFYNVEFI